LFSCYPKHQKHNAGHRIDGYRHARQQWNGRCKINPGALPRNQDPDANHFEENEKIFQILQSFRLYFKVSSPSRILEAIKEIYEGGAPMSPFYCIESFENGGSCTNQTANESIQAD
jgi:hypothetical protein